MSNRHRCVSLGGKVAGTWSWPFSSNSRVKKVYGYIYIPSDDLKVWFLIQLQGFNFAFHSSSTTATRLTQLIFFELITRNNTTWRAVKIYQFILNHAWFQASATLFWGFTQGRLVVRYRRFGTTYQSHLKVSSDQIRMDCLTLEDGTDRLYQNVGI